MIQIKIIEYCEKDYLAALNYFEDDYKSTLQGKQNFNISLVARYYISHIVRELFGRKQFLPLTDVEGKPLYSDNVYWSISHKNGSIMIGVGDQKIGLDLELLQVRSKELWTCFDDAERAVLGGKSWDNFYIIWTLKESVIKLLLGNLDMLNQIKVVDKIVCKSIIGGLVFDTEYRLEYNGKLIKGYSFRDSRIVYSITY